MGDTPCSVADGPHKTGAPCPAPHAPGPVYGLRGTRVWATAHTREGQCALVISTPARGGLPPIGAGGFGRWCRPTRSAGPWCRPTRSPGPWCRPTRSPGPWCRRTSWTLCGGVASSCADGLGSRVYRGRGVTRLQQGRRGVGLARELKPIMSWLWSTVNAQTPRGSYHDASAGYQIHKLTRPTLPL